MNVPRIAIFLVYIGMGWFLARQGFTVLTYQFWVIMLGILAVDLLRGVER